MQGLSKQHEKELLTGSAISAAVVEQRGYRTVTDKDDLEELGFSSVQRVVPGLLVPMYAPSGQVAVHQFKPDKPRVSRDSGKPVKYETPRGSRVRMDVPPAAAAALPDPTVPLWITEGVKKADAAVSAGLCCIAFTGVDAWRRSDEAGVSGPLPDWDRVNLTGRTVYVAFDSDAMTKDSVEGARIALTVFLVGRGAQVWWVYLPQEKNAIDNTQKKTGLDDYLADGNDVEDLLALARRPRLPFIKVNGRGLRDLTDAAVAALALVNDPAAVFRRADALLEVVEGGISELRDRRLTYRLTQATDWLNVKQTRDGDEVRVPTDPPKKVVENVSVAWEQWPFPALDRVVSSPVFSKDGELRTEPGYHPASRTLYLPPEGLHVPPVPTAPTAEDVRKAAGHLKELLQDFRFVEDADRASALALLLQPFVREMIWGQTPIFSITAAVHGTGKTALAESLLLPSLGRVDSMPEPHGDDEMRKALTTVFRAGAPVVFFDNVDRFVSYPSLASALTKETWSDRLLGGNERLHAPITCTWLMTGNNPSYSGEMARRVVSIRLGKQPDDYTFALSLPRWAKQNRGDLIWAACVLVRAWVVAGKPPPPDAVPLLRSYGPWRRVLGGVLAFHKVRGFLDNLEAVQADANTEEGALAYLCDVVVNKEDKGDEPFTASEVLHYVQDDPDAGSEILRASKAGERSNDAIRLGAWMRKQRGRTVNGYRLDRLEERSSSGQLWRFTTVDEG